jgi:hypothetical protein
MWFCEPWHIAYIASAARKLYKLFNMVLRSSKKRTYMENLLQNPEKYQNVADTV